jgi:hypothetical protein
MVKIEVIPAKAKVYWRGILFPIVSFLLFSCVARSQNASATANFSRQGSHQTEAASHSGLRERTNGEDLMASKSKTFRKKSRRVPLTFEKLEDRTLFSVSQPAFAISDHLLGPVSPDSSSQPPLAPMNSPPPLASVWKPLVYAGQDMTIGLGTTALLNGEIISNTNEGLTVKWKLVSGPGVATISNPNTANASATFSAAGVYEFELRVANAFAVASDLVVVTVAEVMNIDQAWLDERGDGPYYLDQAGKAYVLQTDVMADGTAFAIIASNVTFDLNGHTITYDNSAPITIFNASFESGTGTTAAGWNFSGAPSASRHFGNWLHNEVYDGSYSLKFTLPAANQYVISTSTITLEANTTYSLSAMFEYGGQGDATNPGAKGYVRLVGTGLPTREVSWNSTNSRGIQLREGTFTTGNTAETYQIRVGIEGAGSLSASSAKPFYIDDIKIQRTKVYGVATAAYNWSLPDYPGMTRWGKGSNATIRNGTIIQGANGATWGHGVFIHTTDGVTVQNLNITVHGSNSSAIYGKDQGILTSRVLGNTLTSNVKTISSRDNFHGAVVFRLQGDIFNNMITNGVHAGIVAANGTTQNRIASNIYSNTIQLSSRYTNGFAIIGTSGSQIHDNTINCGQGGFAARGILVSEGEVSGTTTRVYGNTIHVQQLVNNQEYEGVPLGGAYGIQLENVKNVEVYNNDVFAYGNEVSAYAFRMNSDGGTSEGAHVHDNLFRAISNGEHAAALKLTGIEESNLLFEDNELVTNDGFVGGTSSSFVTLRRSTITAIEPIGSSHPIDSEYQEGQGLHTRIIFLDNVFSDAGSRTYLESAVARILQRYGGALDNRVAFDVRWTTTIQARNADGAALPNATVAVSDKTGTVIISGMTNADGRLTCTLIQFSTQGGTKTDFNPYTVAITANGQQAQQQFNADGIQTIQLQIGAGATSNSLLMESESVIDPLFIGSDAFNNPTSSGANSDQLATTLLRQLTRDFYFPTIRNLLVVSASGDSNYDQVVHNQATAVESSSNGKLSHFRGLDQSFEEWIKSTTTTAGDSAHVLGEPNS